MSDWFKKWFDSPYYHILYRERDDREARHFLDNIIAFLDPQPDARILDQACGHGRHAVYLNKLGYHVTGADLSEKNIAHCLRFSNEKLHFRMHDMRNPFPGERFDYIFNIFTSMGYFATDAEQQHVVESTAASLLPCGKYVVDFMNVRKVTREMVPEEIKSVGGIDFTIRRTLEEGFIRKYISFSDRGRAYSFAESVEALTREDFERYFSVAGLDVRGTFGNYRLDPFQPDGSDRLILIAEKTPLP